VNSRGLFKVLLAVDIPDPSVAGGIRRTLR